MMVTLKQAIIVEGKYDKMHLEKICDCPIFTTEGFRIFNDKERRAFLQNLAKTRGLLVLTDSDRAGFMIRNFIKNVVKEGSVTNVYIPEIYGKERRKTQPSKEGKLGVEGIPHEVLIEMLERYSSDDVPKEKITKTDLYSCGLYGGTGSGAARIELCRRLSVPVGISVNSLIDALNAFVTKEEFYELAGVLTCMKDTD